MAKCLGLCELFDGTNRDHIFFDSGKFYVYDASKDPQRIEDAGTTTFATDDIDLYSVITFGGYCIFADRGEHTPYKWKHGDANLTKLILSGTEYKFRYLMHLANRIVGLYSDQANGDLEIRWTDALPAWATLDFDVAHQLYKPEGDESITGGISVGPNTGLVYSRNDITRLDYYGSASPVFSAVRILRGWGSVNHACLVTDGQYVYFYDENKGFCRYAIGGAPEVISENIEDQVASLTYTNLTMGKYWDYTGEIVWNVTTTGTNPNQLWFFNPHTGQWRKEIKATRVLDTWYLSTYSQIKQLVYGDEDGHLYVQTGEDDNTGNWDGYRIEPILPMSDPKQKKRLIEIWADISYTINKDLDFYWRGGDTEGEVDSQGWTSLGSINMNDPANAVLYCDQTARLHQIKWGTDLKDEYFSINGLTFVYSPQGKY